MLIYFTFYTLGTVVAVMNQINKINSLLVIIDLNEYCDALCLLLFLLKL